MKKYTYSGFNTYFLTWLRARLTYNNKQLNANSKQIFAPKGREILGELSPPIAAKPRSDDISSESFRGFGDSMSSPRECDIAPDHQISGIRAQLRTKPTTKLMMTLQQEYQSARGEYMRLTCYLTNRRRDFAREACDPVCERALRLYDKLKHISSAIPIHLGHIHPRTKKNIIPGMAVVWTPYDMMVYFLTDQGDYRMRLSDEHLTPNQINRGFQAECQYRRVVTVPVNKVRGIKALADLPVYGGR